MLISEENKIIHGLWIGTKLSPVELLCLHSFVAKGHTFWLWHYDKIITPIPKGVFLHDANEIIDRESVFNYSGSNQYGHGKGSYAGFSDIFRYKLLYLYGGWWTDMDVLCLKTLNFTESYIFRTHHEFPVVGNLMKCEKGSACMLQCYERSRVLVNRDNKDWNLPIRILNEEIENHGHKNNIREITNPDSWLFVRKLLLYSPSIPEKWFALHLVNEEWRRHHLNKSAIAGRSYIGKAMISYNILPVSGFSQKAINVLRIIIIRFSFRQLLGFIKKVFRKILHLFVRKKQKNLR